MIKKIALKNDPERLRRDLDRYVGLALAGGATDAGVIRAEQLVVDERVRMKCRFPLCNEYGACMNCPPNTGSIAESRERIGLFEYAIVMRLEVPGERVAGAAARGEGIEDLKKLNRIIAAVESAAFYDGYYFATGFGSASCHFTWCQGTECQALAGKGCRQPNARIHASMEAAGIDVFRLIASLGWDIYPIGKSASADMFPCASRCGMVLIQ